MPRRNPYFPAVGVVLEPLQSLQEQGEKIDELLTTPLRALQESRALQVNPDDAPYVARFKNVLYEALNTDADGGSRMVRAFLEDQTYSRDSALRQLYQPRGGEDAVWSDIMQANMRRHNDLWNLAGPNAAAFEEEEGFSPEIMWEAYNELRVRRGAPGLPRAFEEIFDGTRSRMEWLDKLRKIQQEMIDQRFLNTVHWWDDFLASAAATFLSPISFVGVPALALKATSVSNLLVKGAVRGGGWGVAQAAAQEAILYGAQDMRTVQESLLNTSGAAFFGVLLGTGISTWSLIPKSFRAKAEGMTLNEMLQEQTIIPGAADTEEAIRAQRGALGRWGGLPGRRLEDWIDHMAPNIRLAHNQFSETLADYARRTSVSGLNFHQRGANIFQDAPDVYVPAPGGDVESLAMLPNGKYWFIKRKAIDEFKNLRKRLGRKEAPSWETFRKDVFHNMLQREDIRAIRTHPEIKAAADGYRDFFLDFYREAKQLEELHEVPYKIYEGVSEGEFINNFVRYVDKAKVNDRVDDFKALLRGYADEELRGSIRAKRAEAEQAAAELEAEAELIGIDPKIAQAEIIKRDIELMELPHQMGVDTVVGEIERARSHARSIARADPEKAETFWQKARDLERLHSELMDPYKAKRAELQRGRRLLERSAYGIMREQQQVNAEIEAVEEALTNSLGVFERNIHKFLGRQERFSVQASNDEFARLQGEYDRIEAMIQQEASYQRRKQGLVEGEEPSDESQRHLLSRLTRRADLVDKLDEVNSTYEQKRERAGKMATEARERIKKIALERGARRERLQQKLESLNPEHANERALALSKLKQAELEKFREWAEKKVNKDADEPVAFTPDEHNYGAEGRGFATRAEAEAAARELGEDWRAEFYVEGDDGKRYSMGDDRPRRIARAPKDIYTEEEVDALKRWLQEFVDGIVGPGRVTTQAFNTTALIPHGPIGQFRGARSGSGPELDITLRGSHGPLIVSAHETFHAVKALGLLTPEENATLIKAAYQFNWHDKFAVRRRWPGERYYTHDEEAIAEGFGRYVNENYTPPDEIKTLFDRMKQYIQDIWDGTVRLFQNLFREEFPGEAELRGRAEGIFKAMLSGEFAGRAMDPLQRAILNSEPLPPPRSGYRLVKHGDVDVEAAAAGRADEIYKELMSNKSPGEIEFVRASRKTAPQLSNLMSEQEFDGVKFSDFLEDDADAVAHRFMRSHAGDIASFKVFKTPTPYDDLRDTVVDEFEKANEGLRGTALARQRAKQTRLLHSARAMDAEVRGLRGAGEDTRAFGWILGKQLQNYIVVTTGGTIGLTTLQDISQFLLHFSLGKLFKGEFRLMTQGFKNLSKGQAFRGELAPGEVDAKYASAGTEYMRNNAWTRVWDIARDDMPQSKPERVGNALATGFGYAAGYTPLTNHFKRLSGIMGVESIIKDTGKLVGAYPSSQRQRQQAAQFLGRAGITPAIAEDIWRNIVEVPGGGTQIDGIWHPNMKFWDNPQTRDAVLAGTARIVENSPIAPGLEVYTWVASSPVTRLIATYKRFAISSTIKLLRFADQEAVNRPVNTAIAVAVLLGISAMNFYLKGLARGGSRWERVQEASPETWMYETFVGSGLLAMGQEPLSFLGRTPLFDNWLEPTTESTRTVFGRPVGQLGGVAEGKIYTADKFLSSFGGGPGAATVRTGSRLLPFRNHALLARGFTAAEDFIIDEFDLDKSKKKSKFAR